MKGMLDMQEKLKNLRKLAEEQIKSAGNMEEVEKLRVDLLGKKGELLRYLRKWASCLQKKGLQ